MIEVRNQAELDKALERQDVLDGEVPLVIIGNGRFVVDRGNPTMESSGQSNLSGPCFEVDRGGNRVEARS